MVSIVDKFKVSMVLHALLIQCQITHEIQIQTSSEANMTCIVSILTILCIFQQHMNWKHKP
jgi:hypothetical protein